MKDKAKEPERAASAGSSAKSLNEAVERSKGKKNTNETKAKVQLPAPQKAPKTVPKAVPKTAPKEAEMKIHVQKNGTRRFDTLQVSPSNQILDVLQQYLQVRVR